MPVFLFLSRIGSTRLSERFILNWYNSRKRGERATERLRDDFRGIARCGLLFYRKEEKCRKMDFIPNQRHVTVHSSGGRCESEIDRPYGIITRSEEVTAIKVLGKDRNLTPLILFFHFALNKNNYSFGFSPKQMEDLTGISSDRWRCAFKYLVQKKYLVPDNREKNKFHFYSFPACYKDIPADGYTCQQGEGIPVEKERYTCQQGEGIPADRERVYPPTGREIIHNNTVYNTDNNTVNNTGIENIFTNFKQDYPNRGRNVPLDKRANHTDQTGNSKSIQQEIIEFAERRRNEHIEDVKRKAYSLHQQWLNSISTDSSDAVLDKYLSSHKEPNYLKRLGDKYGRIIDGWDEKKCEPIICYFAFQPMSLKHIRHNLSGIPYSYYVDKEMAEYLEALSDAYENDSFMDDNIEFDVDDMPF